MNRKVKTMLVSGIKWGGDLEHYDDYGKQIPLPTTFEVGVVNTKGITMDFLKKDITDNVVGYGSESYVESIGKVTEIIVKMVDRTEEVSNEG